MKAIEVRNLTKIYKLYTSPMQRFMELWSLNGSKRHQEFFALRDVSFSLEQGRTLGIIGPNGGGKSTLLQILCGVVHPTSGEAHVRGRVSALLELGAGFNLEFTGRENVYMNGALMGYGRKEMDRRFPAIRDFAEIGDFMEQPVKTYSSGMFVRLAFAAAINVDPDILVVDEALAVGDASFQHRCNRKIRELQGKGITMILVSHDMLAIKSLCHEVLLMEKGSMQFHGNTEEGVNLYHERVAERMRSETLLEEKTTAAVAAIQAPAVYREDPAFAAGVAGSRHGSGAARITNVEILDNRGRTLEAADFDQPVRLRIHILFEEVVPSAILGYYFRDKNGIETVGTNTFEENISLPLRNPGQALVVDFVQRLPLAPGAYSVAVALAYDEKQPRYLDWIDNAKVLTIRPPEKKKIHSRVWLPVEIQVHER